MRRNIDRSWSRWTRSLGEGGEHTVKPLSSRHLPIPNRGIHLYGAEALSFIFLLPLGAIVQLVMPQHLLESM